MQTHPFVARAGWMASMYAAIGNTSAADSYIMAMVAWYVSHGGTFIVRG